METAPLSSNKPFFSTLYLLTGKALSQQRKLRWLQSIKKEYCTLSTFEQTMQTYISMPNVPVNPYVENSLASTVKLMPMMGGVLNGKGKNETTR